MTTLLSYYNDLYKVIWYVVLTMHILKLWLGYLKELKFSVLFSDSCIKPSLNKKKKSAAMPFGNEGLLSQWLVQTHF